MCTVHRSTAELTDLSGRGKWSVQTAPRAHNVIHEVHHDKRVVVSASDSTVVQAKALSEKIENWKSVQYDGLKLYILLTKLSCRNLQGIYTLREFELRHRW
jgi:hypothetical protein